MATFPTRSAAALLNVTSPAKVVPVQLNGDAAATSVVEISAAEIRMSPNRASPCTAPGVPSGCPPSATTATLMLALAAHVWNARRISPSHTAGAPAAAIVRNSELGPVGVAVPSGTKLRVMCPASAQGTPNELGSAVFESFEGDAEAGA